MDTQRTLDALRTLPDELADALAAMTGAQTWVVDAKTEVARLKEGLDWATAEATLSAYADGAVTGKNQAERDVQVTAYLSHSVAMEDARARLRDAEDRQRDLEAKAQLHEATYKAAYYRLRAALAEAELMAAILNATVKEARNGDE